MSAIITNPKPLGLPIDRDCVSFDINGTIDFVGHDEGLLNLSELSEVCRECRYINSVNNLVKPVDV